MESPLVSVYIPTYKRPELLKRAVASVVNQSYYNIEIIVSCDGDCKDTRQVVEDFLKKHSNIRFITSASRQGSCATRNAAINLASGEFITGLDDDDFFSANRVKGFIDNVNDKQRILFSNYKVMDEFGITTTEMKSHVSLNDLLKYNCIGNQVFCPTEFMRKAGGFDEELPAWQDYDMWIRLVAMFGAAKGIKNASYTTDKTHAHERISSDMKAIENAYSIFEKKYDQYKLFRYKKYLDLNFLKNAGVESTLIIWVSAISTMRYDLILMLYLRRCFPKLRHKLRKLWFGLR
jgi:glycosyltransferase involved in cell wall biosynthesis